MHDFGAWHQARDVTGNIDNGNLAIVSDVQGTNITMLLPPEELF